MKAKIFVLFFMTAIMATPIYSESHNIHQHNEGYVTIAILAKDKAHTLPLYLECIEKQTWPADKIYLYIRTNNNRDNTAQLLHEWIAKVKNRYAGIFIDDSDVEQPVQNFSQHEWNSMRFKVLGKVRQDSVIWAREHNSHYFVVDCDNFIYPETLEELVKTNLPIVAPLLKESDYKNYSNYHSGVDANGYWKDTPLYCAFLHQQIKGLIQQPVVHCTYLIRYDVLDKILYDDSSQRYEYVIFSDNARKQGIAQYLDNRKVYGRLTFSEDRESLLASDWLHEFNYTKAGGEMWRENSSIKNKNIK